MPHGRNRFCTIGGRALAVVALLGIFGCLCLSDIPSTALRHRLASAPAQEPHDAGRVKEAQDPAFPSVDWAWWQSANPDVVGWITIPGTCIDDPIVQASKEAPGFYLNHDVYGNASSYGCVYLDADCPAFSPVAENEADAHAGIAATGTNRLICGHNPGFGNHMQFADLAGYSDSTFALEHRTVLLQTPWTQRTLHVACTTIEAHGGSSNRTSFAHAREFTAWWNGVFATARVRTESKIPATTQVFTLCTCSYGGDDERTLVFAYDPEEP